MSIIRKDYVVVDRFYSGYLEEFIDDYAVDMDCSQNSYFVIYLSDIEELIGYYGDHKEALETFRGELADSGASKCVVMYWW